MPVTVSANDIALLARHLAPPGPSGEPPWCVAIDGRSGAGKSTLARRLAAVLGAALIEGDDFFAGSTTVSDASAEQLARDCIDWRRQRVVLEALRAGCNASYCAFDWDAFDGSLAATPTLVEPRPVIIVEGVYSARSELADLFDVRALLQVPEERRLTRLLAREGSLDAWQLQWHPAEQWYFRELSPPSAFDLIIDDSACQ